MAAPLTIIFFCLPGDKDIVSRGLYGTVTDLVDAVAFMLRSVFWGLGAVRLVTLVTLPAVGQ
eukprot:7853526-Ditylum_brightwellii.AAC.1